MRYLMGMITGAALTACCFAYGWGKVLEGVLGLIETVAGVM